MSNAIWENGNTLIDNSSEECSIKTALKELITRKDYHGLYQYTDIKIATAYWDIKAIIALFAELKEFLDRPETTLELLIGEEPKVYKSQIENYIDDKKRKMTFREQDKGGFIRSVHELNFTDKIDKDCGISVKEIIDWLIKIVDVKDKEAENPKFRIHVFDNRITEQIDDVDSQSSEKKTIDRTLHAKCYIFTNAKGDSAVGIIGSSNFTGRGIGLDGNRELNHLETHPEYVVRKNFNHLQWFEQMWAHSVKWNGDFIQMFTQHGKDKTGTPISPENYVLSPYETYIKMLSMSRYGKPIQIDEKYLPKHYDRLQYQIKGASHCYDILNAAGGFFLADDVGLGKTVTAVLVIRHYIETDNSTRPKKVLVIVPGSGETQWKDTIDDFDTVEQYRKLNSCVDIITIGKISQLNEDESPDLQEETLRLNPNDNANMPKGPYGMILIDESHRFRNKNTWYKALTSLISNIYYECDEYPYIGLLSATPMNNSPEDLHNQIKLFTHQYKDTVFKNIGDIDDKFREWETEFENSIKLPQNDRTRAQKIKEIAEQIDKWVMRPITERRTRKDVEDEEKFPKTDGPYAMRYELGDELTNLLDETTSLLFEDSIKLFGYYRYRAEEFYIDESKQGKGAQRSKNLYSLNKSRMVKRLESSVAAFKESLSNLRNCIINMMGMWKDHQCVLVSEPQKYKEKLSNELSDKELASWIEEIRQLETEENKSYLCNSDEIQNEWFEGLENDFKLIDPLFEKWKSVTSDPKLDEFKNRIDELLSHESHKLVIFSEAKMTCEEIEKILKDRNIKTLRIDGSSFKEFKNDIRASFDRNYIPENVPESERGDDSYQVIVATDVLAESINLHKANTILNFDIPWNPTRMMQREGRVNRKINYTLLGLPKDTALDPVHVYNFQPSNSKQLNRIQAKLEAFHGIFASDHAVLSTEEYEIIREREERNQNDRDSFECIQRPEPQKSDSKVLLEELETFKRQNPDSYHRIVDYSKPIAIAWEADNSDVIGILQDRGRTILMTQKDGAGLSDDEILLRCRCTPDTEHIEKTIDIDKISSEFKNKYDEIDANHFDGTQGHLGDLPENKDKCREFTEDLANKEEEFYQSHFEQFLILDEKIDNSHTGIIDRLIEFKSQFDRINDEKNSFLNINDEKNSFLNTFEEFLNSINQNNTVRNAKKLSFPIIIELIQSTDECSSDTSFNKEESR